MTPHEFGREVAKAIARSTSTLTTRIEKAREDRRVWCTALPDGMGFLGLIHDWTTVQAIHATITADGRTLQLDRGGSAAVRAGDDDARADASRADAMAARMLGTVAEDGSVTWDRSTQQVVSMTLVMDLDTLQGEVDRFALLDGQPIPAGLARDLAEGAKLWRRAVTDPVTGVLLDYGTEQYLPETAAPLRQGPRRRVRHPDLLTHQPPRDGPRRAVPRRNDVGGQLPCLVHDLPPAQDRATTALHRHEARRISHVDHRVGAAVLDPAQTLPPRSGRPSRRRARSARRLRSAVAPTWTAPGPLTRRRPATLLIRAPEHSRLVAPKCPLAVRGAERCPGPVRTAARSAVAPPMPLARAPDRAGQGVTRNRSRTASWSRPLVEMPL